MKNKIISLALIAGLAACSGGNPFESQEEPTGETPDGEVIGDGQGTGIDRDGIPPGTASPSAGAAIFRSEERNEEEGNGYATGMSYNSANDTFTVDNIAFDGDRPYSRGTAVSSLSPDPANNNRGRFAVYEAPAVVIDPVNNKPINQLGYRAIYGVSRNTVANSSGVQTPTTQFAIVRTGSYEDYGFGGFIYQRDTNVTLPNTLQATFSGHSAGLRDSNRTGLLQYTTADMTIDIDHDDFNDGTTILGDGVKGTITNRRVFDLNGVDITSDVAGTLVQGLSVLPAVTFTVGPDTLDTNGELLLEIGSNLPNENNSAYETGMLYAIVSGDDPDEIVGVYVLEGTDGSRDTSGFIVYRDDPA